MYTNLNSFFNLTGFFNLNDKIYDSAQSLQPVKCYANNGGNLDNTKVYSLNTVNGITYAATNNGLCKYDTNNYTLNHVDNSNAPIQVAYCNKNSDDMYWFRLKGTMYAVYKQDSTGFTSVSYINHGYNKTSTALLASYVPFNTGLSKSIDDEGNFFHTAQVNASNIMCVNCNINNKSITHNIINISNYNDLYQHSRTEYNCVNSDNNYCQLIVNNNNVITYESDFKGTFLSQVNITNDGKTLGYILFRDNNDKMKLGVRARIERNISGVYSININNVDYGKITHTRTGIVINSENNDLIFASEDAIYHISVNPDTIYNNFNDVSKWNISTVNTINIDGDMEFATQNTINREYIVKTNKYLYRYNYINKSINISPCIPTQKNY